MAAWQFKSLSRVSWLTAAFPGVVVLPAASLALASPQLVPPEQVSQDAGGLAVNQLGGQAQPIVSAPPLPANPQPPAQLTQTKPGQNKDLPQVQSPEGGVGKLQSLSRPDQSAPLPLVALKGEDRCKPEKNLKDQPKICRRPVEARADEFAHTAIDVPVQSPEKRILGSRSTPSGDAVARDAATGSTGDPGTADDSTAQAIASIVLTPPPPATKEPVRTEDPAGLRDIPGMSDPAGSGILLPPPGQP